MQKRKTGQETTTTTKPTTTDKHFNGYCIQIMKWNESFFLYTFQRAAALHLNIFREEKKHAKKSLPKRLKLTTITAARKSGYGTVLGNHNRTAPAPVTMPSISLFYIMLNEHYFHLNFP